MSMCVLVIRLKGAEATAAFTATTWLSSSLLTWTLVAHLPTRRRSCSRVDWNDPPRQPTR